MRALILREWTDFANLTIEENWPEPIVSPGILKIRTQAIGINFALSLRTKGEYQIRPELPHVPGVELCGYVSEIGDGVSGFRIGDRVTSFVTYGALAEHCLALPHRTFVLPDAVDFHQAVGLTSSYMTSYAALVWPQWVNIASGETLLVHGAAGGVGLSAIAIGKIRGARVIATVGSEEKRQCCLKHGADIAINYREDDFVEKVWEQTDHVGANAVLDPVGGDLFLQSLRCLAPEGRIVPLGFAGGQIQQIPANILLAKNIKILALNYGYYIGQWGRDPRRHKDMGKQYEALVRESMQQLFFWIEQERIHLQTAGTFGFGQFREAMQLVLSRKAIGRVSVVLDEEARKLGIKD